MGESGNGKSSLFLSHSWLGEETELSFVTRSIAGAASRLGEVTVLVPAGVGSGNADGAFDVLGIGKGAGASWPARDDVKWPVDPSRFHTIVADRVDESLRALLGPMAVSSVNTVHPFGDSGAGSPGTLKFAPRPGAESVPSIGLLVPVNPLAAAHRHNGLGFTGYILVLSDRSTTASTEPPTDAVAWITAAFNRASVVVVENADATVWQGRVRRGVVSVDTRTDLWRLLAHARVTIDLSPGEIFGRECIESLRFATPVIVPAHSAAAAHAAAGGGLTFSDMPGLLHCVEQISDDIVRSSLSADGRQYAERQYGDPRRFVDSVARALWPPGEMAGNHSG
jgi:hypothetical protein